MNRFLWALALVLAVVALPAVAEANSPDAKYYVSTVTAIEPAVPGLEVITHGGGESITLTNRTGKRVVVLGYSGEDYLRFDPSGTQVNINSPTAALNADGGRSGIPARLSKAKPLPAKWQSVADTGNFTWQDFRPRWSNQQRPPIVQADPHARHQVFAWAIQLEVDRQPALVRGDVTWTGTPEPDRTSLAMVGGGAAVLLLALVLAFWWRGHLR
ncbi:MAG TPA: hypothetical protein VLL08_15815 [Kineosporiaceae bacterium]|nr:hypothetical protein [Kineosporiaceae bacterium]